MSIYEQFYVPFPRKVHAKLMLILLSLPLICHQSLLWPIQPGWHQDDNISLGEVIIFLQRKQFLTLKNQPSTQLSVKNPEYSAAILPNGL